MPFQALTCAPMIRDGVTFNIMAYPQADGSFPHRLVVGAPITLRFGNCCPLVKQGNIVAVADDPERALLSLDGTTWTLEPCSTVVDIPGIASRDWIVRSDTS